MARAQPQRTPRRRFGAARVVSAPAVSANRRPGRAEVRRRGPSSRRGCGQAARRRGARDAGVGPDRRGRTRGRPSPVAATSPRRPPPPRRRAATARVPSRRPRSAERARRIRPPRARAQTRGDDLNTPHSALPAMRWARRSAHSRAARCAEARLYIRNTPVHREENRRGSVAAAGDRAHIDVRSQRVTCQCQLGEYSARSGSLWRRRMRLSASSSCVWSPMSYHSPGKRYA